MVRVGPSGAAAVVDVHPVVVVVDRFVLSKYGRVDIQIFKVLGHISTSPTISGAAVCFWWNTGGSQIIFKRYF